MVRPLTNRDGDIIRLMTRAEAAELRPVAEVDPDMLAAVAEGRKALEMQGVTLETIEAKIAELAKAKPKGAKAKAAARKGVKAARKSKAKASASVTAKAKAVSPSAARKAAAKRAARRRNSRLTARSMAAKRA